MTERTTVLNKTELHAAWLLVINGPRRGRDYRLARTTNLGRDSQANQVIVDDDATSAEHARIRYENGTYVLYDLASSNGTWLNGERTQKAILRDGDRLELGHSAFIYKEVKVS